MFYLFDNFRQTPSFFTKKQYFLYSLAILLLIFVFSPSLAQAHAYSASYTNIKINKDKTEFVFSIDTLSIIELIEGIDKNNNNEVDKKEMNKENHHLEELVTERLSFDKENREQVPILEKMELIKKENKNFISFHLSFPAFSPEDTISLNDGFYVNDPATNYVNFVSIEYAGETGQAILQGNERSWTMLLTEPQLEQEQQTTDGQIIQPDSNQAKPESDEPVKSSLSNSWFSFFKLGMLHILTGYDHLLFLFVLLIRKQTLKQYIGIVTSFTIAHSITISLAVLGLITLPSRFVEATIAFSICYVALENIFRKEIKNRWSITFLFGLIHGLGFASILREMNIPKSNLAVALVNFNIGIEFIQLLIVLLLLPLLVFIQRQSYYGMVLKIGSIIITILGAIWLIERIFL